MKEPNNRVGIDSTRLNDEQDGSGVTPMRYSSEVEVKEVLGIESWRNLSKDTFLRFLATMPEIDREVALKLIGQIPEITTFARVALDDAAKAYDAALTSNARSQEMVHQVHLERLAILKAELAKDLSPEERMRVLDDIRDVNSSAFLKDTENKNFLAEQFDKRLAVVVVVAATLAAVVFVATKSGHKPGVSAARVFGS